MHIIQRQDWGGGALQVIWPWNRGRLYLRLKWAPFPSENIHEAIIIHMINREEHRGTVMSIVIMGFVQNLRDKGVCSIFF